VNTTAKVAIGFGSIVGVIFTGDIVYTTHVKKEAWNCARSLAGTKGVINLGAGPDRVFPSQRIALSPEVVANVDIIPDGLPHYFRYDIENELPFADKQFSVSYASHILEHLGNWQLALEEACRVADFAVIVLPHPLSPWGKLSPAHKQHFSRSDIEQMGKNHNNVVVFY